MRVYFQQVLLLDAGSEPFPHPRWLRRIDHTEISVNRVLTPSRSFFRAGYFVRSMARKPHLLPAERRLNELRLAGIIGRTIQGWWSHQERLNAIHAYDDFKLPWSSDDE